jgi:undecaprenyl pyrophosphate synthase
VWTEIAEGMLADLVELWSGAAPPDLAAELAPLLEVDRVTVFVLSSANLGKRTDMSKDFALGLIERLVCGSGGGGGGGGTDSAALLFGRALACFGRELCVSVVGDRSLLPADVDHKLAHMQRECKGARYFLTLAVGYDGEKDLDGGLSREEVPAIDAVFRSGREKRLSGFFPR